MSTSQALVKDLEGEVSVTRNGEVVNIKVGDYLLPGDAVVTGDTGRLSLEFPGVEGQEPAAGVMTPNGKITLGEQDSPNGPQMLVMEDTECFEFTTEVTELSSVAQDTGAAGLFGGLAAGGGMIAAGIGAVAAGLFAGGGGGGSGDETNIDGTSGSSPSSGPLAPVAGEGTPAGNVVSEVIDPKSPTGSILSPITKPIADATGIDATGSASNGSNGGTTGATLPDGTGGTSGGATGGTAGGVGGAVTSGPVGEAINTVNESPLGVVTQPVTDAVVGQLPAESSTPSSDPGPDNIVTVVQDTATTLQNDPSALSPEGTVQALVEAAQQDVTELALAGGTNPVGTLVDTVVDGVNQTPLGEPLSPVTEPVQALADTFDLNSLINAGTDTGLVTSVVDTVGGALEPVTTQVEPLAPVVGTLHDIAVTVDSALADTLGSAEGLFSGADSLGGGTGLSTDALPEPLQEAAGGLLGTVESLAAQLPSGGVEDPTGGLLDTAVSTISSTATDPSSGGSELVNTLTNTLNGLG